MSGPNNDAQQVANRPKQAKRLRNEGDDAEDSSTDNNSEIKTMLLALSDKMDSLQDSMSGVDMRLNNKVDNLEATMLNQIDNVKVDLDNRIRTVSNDMDQRLDTAIADVKLKCDSNVSNAMRTVNNRVDEIRAHHEFRIDRLERYSLEKDIIISGVPLENNDDPMGIIGDMCNALNCGLKQGDFAAVFRLRNNSGNSKNRRSVPIVARLQDDWAKQEITTAYFRKKNLN